LTQTNLEKVLDLESGLLGISGISGDIFQLHEATKEPGARRAIEIFCRTAKKTLGAFIAILGGWTFWSSPEASVNTTQTFENKSAADLSHSASLSIRMQTTAAFKRLVPLAAARVFASCKVMKICKLPAIRTGYLDSAIGHASNRDQCHSEK
jgi:Acetokinase family